MNKNDTSDTYIAHVCLNSKLPITHKDYCEQGFVDISPTKSTCTEQCWKYCTKCEGKGFPVIKKKPFNEKLQAKMENARAFIKGNINSKPIDWG
jgi:hypothetical protein